MESIDSNVLSGVIYTIALFGMGIFIFSLFIGFVVFLIVESSKGGTRLMCEECHTIKEDDITNKMTAIRSFMEVTYYCPVCKKHCKFKRIK